MRIIDTVLVPLDGSEFSRTAVPAAARLAARLDAAIHLLSAVGSVDEAGQRDADLAEVEVPGHRVARTVVVDRDPAGAIHETLRRMPGAVACMATHGRARSTALVGSVATDVVAHGHDPLVLVCPYIEQARRTADVVVCVDDSPTSAGLVTAGLDWADRLGERPVVVTVAEDVQPPATDEPPQRRFGPAGDVERFLEELVQPARAAGRTVDTMALYNPDRCVAGSLPSPQRSTSDVARRQQPGAPAHDAARVRQCGDHHRPPQPCTRARGAPPLTPDDELTTRSAVRCGVPAPGSGGRRRTNRTHPGWKSLATAEHRVTRRGGGGPIEHATPTPANHENRGGIARPRSNSGYVVNARAR